MTRPIDHEPSGVLNPKAPQPSYAGDTDFMRLLKRMHMMERASDRPGADDILVFPGGTLFRTPPFTHGDLKSYLPVQIPHSDSLDSDGH